MAHHPAAKHGFTKANIGNVLFFAAILAILFVPAAKSMLVRGLMAVGFFQPKIEQPAKVISIPDRLLKDAAGNTLNLPSLRGKVVFVNFWATWCGPCLTELPAISQLHKKLSNNARVVFLTIDVENDTRRSALFMKKHGYDLPVYGTPEDFPANILSGTIPTTIVIDKMGNMVFHHEGIADYSSIKFEQYLLKLAAD